MERIVPSIELNAFEAFEIAEKIERNGAGFYHRAAELFDDPGLAKLFLELAGYEKAAFPAEQQAKDFQTR
jgi:rubrerythrin